MRIGFVRYFNARTTGGESCGERTASAGTKSVASANGGGCGIHLRHMPFVSRPFGVHRTVSENLVAQIAPRNAEVPCVCIRHNAHDLPRRVGPGSDCWNKVCADKPPAGVGILGVANVSGRVRRDWDSSFGLAQ